VKILKHLKYLKVYAAVTEYSACNQNFGMLLVPVAHRAFQIDPKGKTRISVIGFVYIKDFFL